MPKDMFEPVNYKLAAQIVGVFGFLLIVLHALNYVLGWEYNTMPVFIIGISAVALSFYLKTLPQQ